MESLIWQEKLPQATIDFNCHRRVIDQLLYGRHMAAQVQTLLRSESRNHVSAALAQDSVEKILRSFTESIHTLSRIEAGEVSNDGGSEDSGASKKRSELGSKNGRGCYKRRKGSQTWTEVTTTVEDDYAWRKYGQKDILNAKFPRCYYRCTHKHDQDCRATKQVQRMDDNQQMYQITYIGEHTCHRTSKLSPQMISDTDPWELSGCLKPQSNSDHALATANVKQGCSKPEDTRSDVTDKSLSPPSSMLEPEPSVACEYDFSSLDMDDFIASCLGIDAVDFVSDEIGNSL